MRDDFVRASIRQISCRRRNRLALPSQRYTRREASRILGIPEPQLRYWERLRLVAPRARWGERFYTFADLVALRTIQQLTRQRIPARRLRTALVELAQRERVQGLPLAQLRIVPHGRDVAVFLPGCANAPISPRTGQFVMDFNPHSAEAGPRELRPRTAADWFERAVVAEAQLESLAEAAEAYRQAAQLAPDWVEAQLNLGATLYQLGRLEDALAAFSTALALASDSPQAHFNLGCVLSELGRLEAAVEHFRQALRLWPAWADAHLYLALACEKLGQPERSRQHWLGYLRAEPHGPWADYARSRLRAPSHDRTRATQGVIAAGPSNVRILRRPS